jgi:uncharacterized protein
VKCLKALKLLIDGGLFTEIIHSAGNGAPLAAEADVETRKLCALDIGLLSSSLGMSLDKFPLTTSPTFMVEGGLAEQFVAQELASLQIESRPTLFYWLRESKSGNAEIDLLLQSGNCVVPIEIKAGASGRMRSLAEFCRIKKSKIAVRFDTNLPSIQKIQLQLRSHIGADEIDLPNGKVETLEFKLISLPLYLACEVERIVTDELSK